MIEITKEEAASLKDLIELNLFNVIRNDVEVDSMRWLCNIVAIYKKCEAGGQE